MARRVELSEQEWRRRLDPDRYHVLREAGTERAFTGPLLDNKQHGVYRCAGCQTELFSWDTKYDSGSGWPSFWQALDSDRIELREDRSLGMVRTEAVCATCGGHLGHVFPDGPEPTGERYCINSLSLEFEPDEPSST